jgi:hypothetical protein
MLRSSRLLACLVFLAHATTARAQETDEPAAATTISIGESVEGILPGGTEGDTYLLTLAEAAWVDVSQLSDGVDCLLRIYDAEGTLIAENDDFGGELDSRIQRQLPAGEYNVVATAYNQEVGGSYRLSVVAWVAEPIARIPMHPEAVTEVALQPVEGAQSIIPLSLSFEIDALRPFSVPVTLAEGNWTVTILGPDGATIGSQQFAGGSHEIPMLPDWLGQHTLTVVAAGPVTEAVSFAVGPVQRQDPQTPMTLESGEYAIQIRPTDTPAFGSGLVRPFLLNAPAGSSVRVEASSNHTGLSLQLRGGATDANGYDDGSGTTSAQAVSLGQPMRLNVHATGPGLAVVHVSTQRSEGIRPVSATVRRPLSGAWRDQPLASNGTQAAVTARIDLTSGVYSVEGDCQELGAIRPTGEWVSLSASEACQGTLVADVAGNWTIVMRDAPDAGDFRLVVLPSDGRTRDLGALQSEGDGDTVWLTGSLGASSTRTADGVLADDFDFSLPQDARVLIGMGTAGIDGYLELYAEGDLVAANDDTVGLDPRLVQNLPAGSYTVRAREYEFAEGPYKVWIQTTPAREYPTTEVSVGQTVHVNFSESAATIADLDRQGVRMHVLIGTPGVYRIAVDGTDMDPVAVLQDALGQTLQSNDDRAPGNLNPEILAPLATGEYVLEIYGYDDRLTQVDVSVTTVD